MTIKVGCGTGSGLTEMSAWDEALFNAGIANFNLLYLSSIIPPKSKLEVFEGRIPKVAGNWGDKLYVVMAQYRQSTVGKGAWAGIGWVQDPETGQGLFTEHEGESEAQVVAEIENTLKTLMKTRGINYGKINMKVAGVTCKKDSVSAVAVAVFESEGWR